MIKVWHRHARGQADYFMVLVVAKSLNIKYEIDWYGSADTRSYKVLFRNSKMQLIISNPDTLLKMEH